MGRSKSICRQGSQLDIYEAREFAPYHNATSLQVCAHVELWTSRSRLFILDWMAGEIE